TATVVPIAQRACNHGTPSLSPKPIGRGGDPAHHSSWLAGCADLLVLCHRQPLHSHFGVVGCSGGGSVPALWPVSRPSGAPAKTRGSPAYTCRRRGRDRACRLACRGPGRGPANDCRPDCI